MDFVNAQTSRDVASHPWQWREQKQRRISVHVLSLAAPVIDAGLLLLSLGLVCWLQERNPIFSAGEMLLAGGAAILITCLCLSRCGIYEVQRVTGKKPCLHLVLVAAAVGGLLFGLELAMLPKILLGRLADIEIRAGAWVGISLLALSGVRGLSTYLFSAWDLTEALRQRVALVGGCDAGRVFIDRVANDPESGIQIAGVYSDLVGEGCDAATAEQAAGSLPELVARCNRGEVDVVVLAVPLQEIARIDRIRSALKNVAVDICVAADIAGLRFGIADLVAIGRTPVINVRGRPLNETQLLQKVIFDRSLAGMLLICLLPVLCPGCARHSHK